MPLSAHGHGTTEHGSVKRVPPPIAAFGRAVGVAEQRKLHGKLPEEDPMRRLNFRYWCPTAKLHRFDVWVSRWIHIGIHQDTCEIHQRYM